MVESLAENWQLWAGMLVMVEYVCLMKQVCGLH